MAKPARRYSDKAQLSADTRYRGTGYPGCTRPRTVHTRYRGTEYNSQSKNKIIKAVRGPERYSPRLRRPPSDPSSIPSSSLHPHPPHPTPPPQQCSPPSFSPRSSHPQRRKRLGSVRAATPRRASPTSTAHLAAAPPRCRARTTRARTASAARAARVTPTAAPPRRRTRRPSSPPRQSAARRGTQVRVAPIRRVMSRAARTGSARHQTFAPATRGGAGRSATRRCATVKRLEAVDPMATALHPTPVNAWPAIVTVRMCIWNRPAAPHLQRTLCPRTLCPRTLCPRTLRQWTRTRRPRCRALLPPSPPHMLTDSLPPRRSRLLSPSVFHRPPCECSDGRLQLRRRVGRADVHGCGVQR